MTAKVPQLPKGPFSFLLYSSKPYRVAAFLAVFSVIFASTLGSLVPYVFKRVVDSVNGAAGFGPESVLFWALIYIVFTFAEALGWRSSGFAGSRWVTGVRATVRETLTEYVTSHGYGYFSSRFAGALGSKITNASDGVKNIIQEILWEWMGFLLSLVVSLILVFRTNLYVGWIFVFWVLVIAPINIALVRKKMPLSIAANERETELRAQTIDVLTNINAMHDYARRGFELARIRNLIDIRRRAGLRNWTYSEWSMTLNNVLESIFSGGMILFAAYLWSIGIVTAGDVILVLTLVVSIRGDLARIGRNFDNFAETISQAREGLIDILHEHDIIDHPLSKDLEVSRGEIRLEDVSFEYESRKIFDRLNLCIEPGQRVGLIGRSGAGKSTLMKLLMRQYDLSGGKILIDGQDIAMVKQESLRGSIAVVPQDPLLFHRSLKENIGYGKIPSTDEEIILAATHAQAHQFIDTLPKKYDTLVGERGINLSGGERQRVAIARAFLKDAKILLLDEATSALDSESEVMIQEALKKLMENKTVIAIAHRLSTLRSMDRLVVMDDGKVIEDGTHDELLKLGGVYAELWAHQAGGFLTA